MKKTQKTFLTVAAVAIVFTFIGVHAQRLYAGMALPASHESSSYPTAQAEGDEGDSFLIPASTRPAGETLKYVDLTSAADAACEAVVYIRVIIGGEQEERTDNASRPGQQGRRREQYDPFEEFFGEFFGPRGQGQQGQRQQRQTPRQEAAGSGVIISKDGYIVTNNHVVEGANHIQVTLNDNREFEASVVGLDATTDLALLKIEATDLPVLPIGDSDALKVGEWVLAVGNPFNLTSTVTAGIVSAKARNVGANRNGVESFIQTDAAINQGNSGGALVNARGELVGINAMLYSQTGSFTGYGFAIPVSIMTKVVSDLRQYGTVQRALLGVSGMDLHNYIDAQKRQDSSFEADYGTLDGVYVAEVLRDGAALAAGIQEGDIIVSLDGKRVKKMSELQEATTQYHPGDTATVGYIRDKKNRTAEITFRNAEGGTELTQS